MTPGRVLEHPPRVLDQQARERYFEDEGRRTGTVAARDVATLPTDKATELCGPARTVVLSNRRVVHGPAANDSSRMRPLLLGVYSAADVLPITPVPALASRTGVVARGQEPTHVHFQLAGLPR